MTDTQIEIFFEQCHFINLFSIISYLNSTLILKNIGRIQPILQKIIDDITLRKIRFNNFKPTETLLKTIIGLVKEKLLNEDDARPVLTSLIILLGAEDVIYRQQINSQITTLKEMNLTTYENFDAVRTYWKEIRGY
jgi:hypothetical protein